MEMMAVDWLREQRLGRLLASIQDSGEQLGAAGVIAQALILLAE